MSWMYLLGILVSIAGMATLDWRYKLAYFADRKRTILTVVICTGVFVLWDLMAIRQGVFIYGNSQYSLPFTIVPEFPVEEIFFLTLLCYCTLVIYNAGVKRWRRT